MKQHELSKHNKVMFNIQFPSLTLTRKNTQGDVNDVDCRQNRWFVNTSTLRFSFFSCLIVLSVVFIAFLPSLAWSQELMLQGLSNDKALVSLDRNRPRFLKLGQSIGGATLLQVDKRIALFKTSREKFELRVGEIRSISKTAKLEKLQLPPQTQVQTQVPEVNRVTVIANAKGHYDLSGQINGQAVNFLLDTGASTIAMSADEARRLGIDYRKGQKAKGQTATGEVDVYIVKLKNVSAEGLSLENVDASVVEGDFNSMLLGMSFLSRIKMTFDTNQLILERKH